ncbi:MAG TPA: sugar-transfer associated ATP-grasp domain-containing protein [Miltoncostaea sp.]|nr:sugar-transfer associated ATP-grasp domain-containing protein [Miltoncostaea sp.]
MPSPLRSPRAAAGQLASLGRVAARAAVRYRVNPAAVVRRARTVRAEGGYEYDEALAAGLLDTREPLDGRHVGTSKHVTLLAQREINPESLAALTEEKAIFYRLLEAYDLPAPALHAVIARSGGWARGRGVIADRDAFAAWLPGVPGDIVVKPSAGVHGRGVRVLRRDGDLLRDLGVQGGDVTPAELHDAMVGDPEFPVWVIQERVRNAPEVARLGSADILQTARVVTVVHPDGTVSVVQCILKVAAGGGAIDNYRGGATGNGIVWVAPDGTLGPVRSLRPDGHGHRTTPDLPATGQRVQGEVLPRWDEALDLARRAAELFLPARSIGWDIALTPDGPMIIEGNMWWDPPGTPDQAIALERLARPTAAPSR